MRLIARIADIISMMIGIIISLRVLLLLLGANRAAPFVIMTYEITDSLLVPFQGIFPSPAFGRVGTIDVPALFGLCIYLALGYLVSEVFITFAEYFERRRLHTTGATNNQKADSSPQTRE